MKFRLFLGIYLGVTKRISGRDLSLSFLAIFTNNGDLDLDGVSMVKKKKKKKNKGGNLNEGKKEKKRTRGRNREQ